MTKTVPSSHPKGKSNTPAALVSLSAGTPHHNHHQTTPQTTKTAMATRKVIPVDKNWEFKQVNDNDAKFLPVAQFPTNVHLDLLHHGLIPDPYVGKNELDVQWIGEKSWVYRTTFTAPALPDGATAVLAFDGLDTFATVVLNGSEVLVSDNMFTPQRVDVTSKLREGVNELAITFDSAYLRGWKEVEKHPDHKWGCWNGDSSRLAVRKAQYEFGWDWGPVLNTCGPWRPINLEVFESRLADLYFHTTVEDNLKSAKVVAHASVEGDVNKVRFDVSLDGKAVASETVRSDGGDIIQATFHINSPALWYPIRYGKQPLYTVKATLLNPEDQDIDTVTKKIGIRRAELIQRELDGQPGTSFFFQVNNIPIYCGGSDWIPADNFLPRITRQRYYDWVKLVADGNQLMIRVWGGGIYEDQAFYDACDELGILVWQDFMFGCGNYPAHPEILKSIKREAVENVKLLRHHPSIVIWAGNNEDYQYQESAGLTYDYENKDAESWLKTDFPARYIYEKILPDVCSELIPETYYHPGSPWGKGKPTADPTVGYVNILIPSSEPHWLLSTNKKSSQRHPPVERMARLTREVPELRQARRALRLRVRHGSLPKHQDYRLVPPKGQRRPGPLPAEQHCGLPQ